MHLLQVERQQAIKFDTSLPPFKEMLVMVNLLLRLMLGASDWVPSLLPQWKIGGRPNVKKRWLTLIIRSTLKKDIE